MKKKFTLSLFTLSLFLFAVSCKKESEPQTTSQPETVIPGPTCDTVNVSYSAKISGILTNNCIGCHGSGFQNYSNYNSFKNWLNASNNKALIIQVLEHKPGVPAMPKDAPQLDSCSILQMKAWINQGAQNN